MDFRDVAGTNRPHRRFGRQDKNFGLLRAAPSCSVSSRRPGEQTRRARPGKRPLPNRRVARRRRSATPPGSPRTPASSGRRLTRSACSRRSISSAVGSGRVAGRRMGRLPGHAEGVEALPATFRTGAVPGCQGRRFVEEEQFGVVAGRHDLTLPPLELQHADDPPLQLPRPPDAALGVVQDATVAHEGAPLRGGDDVAEWGDTILPRHLSPRPA